MAPNWPRLILPLAALTGAAGASVVAPVSVTVAAPQAAMLCLEDPLPVAERGRRAVLVVYALSGGSLSVRADNGETSLIQLFPGGAFDSADGLDPQRFFLPGDDAVSCWRIAPAEGQTARVTLELSGLPD